MSINAVKGVNIGAGMNSAQLSPVNKIQMKFLKKDKRIKF